MSMALDHGATMSSPINLAVATLVAPLAVLPVSALLFLDNGFRDQVLSRRADLGLVVFYAYVLTIFYGLPAFYVLRDLKRLSLWWFWAAAVLPSLGLFVLGAQWQGALWLALCATAVAFVAWALACWCKDLGQ
jgi:hypothetical protein